MAKTLPSVTAARIERTFRVERETPRDGNYRLRVHREQVIDIGDGSEPAVRQILDAVDELVSVTMSRTCARTYLGRCQAAKSLADLVAAEAAFYDELVDERRAEAAAAAAVAAAAAAAAAAAEEAANG